MWKRVAFVDLNLQVLYSYSPIKSAQSAIKYYLKNPSAVFIPVNHVIFPDGSHVRDTDASAQYNCLIEIKKELVFAEADIEEIDAKDKKKVALLVPTLNTDSSSNPPIRKFLLDSLKTTLTEEELKLYHLTVYIGYDHGDAYFGDESGNFDNLKRAYPFLNFRLVQFPKTHWLTFIWNRLFVLAFRDGNDYFLQLNDDARFLKRGWLKSTINMLGSDGVVGLNDSLWQCKLFTQALVNRSHYSRFGGFLFPPQIKDWYSDNWITSAAYPQNSSKCSPDSLFQNGNIKTRYQACSKFKLQ